MSGTNDHKFVLTATDGELPGGGGKDDAEVDGNIMIGNRK